MDGVHTKIAGYITDPQLAAHNLQRAAEAKGGEFLFNTQVTGHPHRRWAGGGVDIEDPSSIDTPIVINVAGPHSFVINQMAGVAHLMRIQTRALRHEVHSDTNMNYSRPDSMRTRPSWW